MTTKVNYNALSMNESYDMEHKMKKGGNSKNSIVKKARVTLKKKKLFLMKQSRSCISLNYKTRNKRTDGIITTAGICLKKTRLAGAKTV